MFNLILMCIAFARKKTTTASWSLTWNITTTWGFHPLNKPAVLTAAAQYHINGFPVGYFLSIMLCCSTSYSAQNIGLFCSQKPEFCSTHVHM